MGSDSSIFTFSFVAFLIISETRLLPPIDGCIQSRKGIFTVLLSSVIVNLRHRDEGLMPPCEGLAATVGLPSVQQPPLEPIAWLSPSQSMMPPWADNELATRVARRVMVGFFMVFRYFLPYNHFSLVHYHHAPGRKLAYLLTREGEYPAV